MSAPWLPDAEYAAIKSSWRTAPRREAAFTNRAAIEMCHRNVQEAAKRESELRALYQELPPGDPLLLGSQHESPLEVRIQMAAMDQRHWRETGAYYRARGEREGMDTVVPVVGTSQVAALPRLKSVPQEPDRRLPREREPGDDDDLGELPF